jgi:hypothetical protein
MIIRAFALIVLMLLIFWALNSVLKKFSLTKKQGNLVIILGVVLTGIVVLIVIGRLPYQFVLAPIGVGLTFLLRMLPAALRLLPLWQMFKGRSNASNSRQRKAEDQTSSIKTEYLAMELQHNSGDMDGVILKGSQKGKRLSGLSLEQLVQFAQESHVDQDTMQLLEAYLDRMHPDWREHAQAGEESSAGFDEPMMTEELAMEVLGLSGEVSKEDITAAHRKLMQKMHPDRGGTDYLATMINTAKDYLIDRI